MTDFSGANCPVCGKGFTETDRPVVCPDCGAPYHSGCYSQAGKCTFSSRHREGFVWKETPADETDEDLDETEDPEVLNENIEFLKRLGIFDDLYQSHDDRFIFGVSEREIAHFQGEVNALRFIRYRQIARGRKISFNLFAGLFSPCYFFYSRMRAAGIAVAFISFVFNLPFMLYAFFTFTGESPPFGQESLLSASNLLSYFSFGFTIIIALFYDYFYLRWMARKIKNIRSQYGPLEDFEDKDDGYSESNRDYFTSLRLAGKPSLLYMLLDSIAVTIALLLFFYFILFYFK